MASLYIILKLRINTWKAYSWYIISEVNAFSKFLRMRIFS